MLAGMFKAPTRYAPHIDMAASRARANEVLTNMVEAGYLTEGQVYGARMSRQDRRAERLLQPDWFLDWAFEEVQRIMVNRKEHILAARTTVDIGLQKAAEQSLQQTLAQYGRARSFDQGALVGMEPDGAVRALVGGKDYGESQFNRATHALRQPGSSFKGYVYLTALEHGYKPTSTVSDGYVSCGRWSPKNYSGGFRGRMTLADALAKSINTIAVKLSLDVGRDKVLANLNKMGITRLKKTCSMALGDSGLTPLEHTGGYAVFAAGGLEVHPYAIEEIHTLQGGQLYSHETDEPARKQIFDRKVVETPNTMLPGVVLNGTGKPRSSTSPIRPARRERAPTIATPGSLASPANMSSVFGSAMTTSRPCPASPAAASQPRPGTTFWSWRTTPTTFPRSPASRRTPFRWPSRNASPPSRRPPPPRTRTRKRRPLSRHPRLKASRTCRHDLGGFWRASARGSKRRPRFSKRYHRQRSRRGASGHAHPNRKRQPAERRPGAARRRPAASPGQAAATPVAAGSQTGATLPISQWRARLVSKVRACLTSSSPAPPVRTSLSGRPPPGALLDAHAASAHRRLRRGASARHQLGAIHDRAWLPSDHQTGRALGKLDE